MSRSDNFNRANTANPLGTPSDAGTAWEQQGGTQWGISGNQAYNSDGAAHAIAVLTDTDADTTVTCTLANRGSDCGIAGRVTDPSNYIVVTATVGTGFRMFKRVAGTFTQLGSTYATDPQNGDVVALEMVGGSLTARINGVSRITATDTHNSTATKHGIRANSDTAARFEDFQIGSAADTTPPTLSSPTGAGGVGVCSGTVSTNEANGTLYAVATASATAPTALQVRNGQDHTGAAALRVASQAVTATGTQTVASGAITGGAGTRFLHYMHEDAAGNRSAVVSSAGFTVTANATQLVVTVPDAAGLSGFSGVVLSAAAPGAGVTVIATPTAITFNGSGQATINIAGLGVPIGARRWVSVTNSNGDPAQSPAPVQAQGPVTAS